LLTVITSGRLAKLIDAMATDRFSVREKLRHVERVLRVPQAMRSRRRQANSEGPGTAS
jgi:hypothetical protein